MYLVIIFSIAKWSHLAQPKVSDAEKYNWPQMHDDRGKKEEL